MSKLANRAETRKLADVLGVDPTRLTFLEAVSAEAVRHVRRAVEEQLFEQDRAVFQRLGRLFRRVPTIIVARLAERVFGPLLTARAAGEMPAAKGFRIAMRLPATFLAEVCREIDPRRARDLIREFPVERILEVAEIFIERKDFATIGRFVDFMPDEAVQGLDKIVDDPTVFVRSAYYVDSRNRLDHLVRLLPRERIRAVVRMLGDASPELWFETLALVSHLSFELQREVGDLVAEHDDAVLTRFVQAAAEEDVWDDMLPIACRMSETAQRRLMNLPAVNDPGVIEGMVNAAYRDDLWGLALPLVRLMPPPLKATVARVAAGFPREAFESAVEAALLGELWDALFEMVGQMPRERQDEVATITVTYGEVDPDLLDRVRGYAVAYGFGASFPDSPAAAPPV